MCIDHWKLVSPDVQRAVYATVVKRGRLIDESWAPWWRAQTKAIGEVMALEGRDPEILRRWLEKEMAVADQMEGRAS